MIAKLLLHPTAVDHARAIEQRTGTYAVVSGGVVELRRRRLVAPAPKNHHLPPWEHSSHQWCAWRTDYGLEHDLCPCPCHGDSQGSQENSDSVEVDGKVELRSAPDASVWQAAANANKEGGKA